MNRILAKFSPISILFTILSFALTLSACGLTKDISDIRVEKTDAVKTIVGAEEFPLPNCKGTSELEMSMSTQAAVKKSVTIGAGAVTSEGGEIGIPEAVKLKLETEVELAYKETYDTASSRLDTIKMKAKGGTHVVYMIEWEEQRFDSTVWYAIGDEVYKAPYTYKLRVPKLIDSREVICPTPSAIWIPEPTSTSSSMPQPPTLTPTPQPPTSTSIPQPPTLTPSYIIEFEADKTEVNPGEWITLRWRVENVQAVYLDWKGGAGAPGIGQASRQMWETTDHTLRVVLTNGDTVTRTITITVK